MRRSESVDIHCGQWWLWWFVIGIATDATRFVDSTAFGNAATILCQTFQIIIGIGDVCRLRIGTSTFKDLDQRIILVFWWETNSTLEWRKPNQNQTKNTTKKSTNNFCCTFFVWFPSVNCGMWRDNMLVFPFFSFSNWVSVGYTDLNDIYLSSFGCWNGTL